MVPGHLYITRLHNDRHGHTKLVHAATPVMMHIAYLWAHWCRLPSVRSYHSIWSNFTSNDTDHWGLQHGQTAVFSHACLLCTAVAFTLSAYDWTFPQCPLVADGQSWSHSGRGIYNGAGTWWYGVYQMFYSNCEFVQSICMCGLYAYRGMWAKVR